VCVSVQGEYIVLCLSESESVCPRVCQSQSLSVSVSVRVRVCLSACLSESESVCQRVCQRWALLVSLPSWKKAEADRAQVYLKSFPSVVLFSSLCIPL
jgi:hypothetical protein